MLGAIIIESYPILIVSTLLLSFSPSISSLFSFSLASYPLPSNMQYSTS